VLVRNHHRYSRPRPLCGCCSTFGSSLDGSSVGITSQRRKRFYAVTSGDCNPRNSSYGRRSFEITNCTRYSRWVVPRRLPLRKRAASRVDQSDSPCCSAKCSGRDTDCLPILLRGLRAQHKPVHAVVHDTDRPFSKTDHLSIALTRCPRSLESSIWRRLTWR
jgi:hypothetical protein